MVPLLNRHFSWEAVHLPMKSYSQLLREASHVKPICCPLIVSSLFFVLCSLGKFARNIPFRIGEGPLRNMFS